MANKVKSKKWDLNKISKNMSPEELLDAWKKSMISEALGRKKAFNNVASFKEWWSDYLLAVNLDDKVNTIFYALRDKKDHTDKEKDWLNERERILDDVDKYFNKLEKVDKLMVKHQKKVKQFLNDEQLKKYKTKIELDFFANTNHQISEEDKVKFKETWGTKPFEDIYEGLQKDSRIDTVYDKNGNKVPGETTWDQAYTSDDRTLRKNTYISQYTFERRNRRTLFLLNKLISQRLAQEARFYKYNHWTEYMCNEVFHITYKDYRYIIEQSSKFTEFNKKYTSYLTHLIVEAYNLSERAPWDKKFKIKDTLDSISIPKAKDLVYEGLSCLGKEYLDKLDICFQNNIINWEGKNKNKPDYCMSTSNSADENIINFNWDGSSVSTITLAHELGHNIRNKFLKENNEINNWSNKITAEIPSIVNSILMSLYLIKKFKQDKAPKTQLYGMYTKSIEYIIYCLNYNGFIYNFIHHCDYYFNAEKDFNPAQMEQMYIDLKKRYYGMSEQAFKKTKKFPYSIEKLECYQECYYHQTNWDNSIAYYIGGIIALSIATKIFNGNKEALNRYYKFLKSGTSTNPIKVIKDTLGINLLKPSIYTEAKQIANKLVNEFIKDIKI